MEEPGAVCIRIRKVAKSRFKYFCSPVRMMVSICHDKAVQKVASLLNPNTPFLVRKSAANSSRNGNVMEVSSFTHHWSLGVAANMGKNQPLPSSNSGPAFGCLRRPNPLLPLPLSTAQQPKISTGRIKPTDKSATSIIPLRGFLSTVDLAANSPVTVARSLSPPPEPLCSHSSSNPRPPAGGSSAPLDRPLCPPHPSAARIARQVITNSNCSCRRSAVWLRPYTQHSALPSFRSPPRNLAIVTPKNLHPRLLNKLERSTHSAGVEVRLQNKAGRSEN